MNRQEQLEILKKETDIVFDILYPLAGFLVTYALAFQLLKVPSLISTIFLSCGIIILVYVYISNEVLKNKFIHNIADANFLIPTKFWEFYRLRQNIKKYELSHG